MEIIAFLRQIARLAGARAHSERGATAVEYGLMLALVAAVIVASVVFLGASTKGSFTCIGNALPKGTLAAGC
jgi:pilus assembly protein Flp/PilA